MPKLALTCVLIAMCFALASTAGAQQPYAGLQARSIKALSDEQIADLRRRNAELEARLTALEKAIKK